MRTFEANQVNDFVINESGMLSIVGGNAAVAAVARSHMQTRRGEMMYSIDEGIPFLPIAWSGTANLAQFEAAARARLMSIPEVLEVVSFSATMAGDTLIYTATLRTDAGEVSVNG